MIAERLEIPATEIACLDDFANHPDLSDIAIVVDGIDPKVLRRWALFLRALSGKSGSPLLGPILIVLLPPGLAKIDRRELCGRAPVISTMGIVSRLDSAAYLSQLGVRAPPDLLSRVGQSVMIDVAAWSRDLIDQIVGWDVADQVAPFVPLEKLGQLKDLPYPSFENGLVDLWDDEPTAHAAAVMVHGLSNHLRRRVWTAQARVLLPFTYRILQSFVLRYNDTLQSSVSPQKPYIKIYNGREIRINDPQKLEFYDISELVSHLMPDRERALLRSAQWTRHAMAHRDVITPHMIESLSDQYEANRDILDSSLRTS
jgi:hypothetical protein